MNFSGTLPSLQGDENGIYEAVGSVGPVSICYDVTTGFQLYKKGVYSRYSPIPTPVWNEPSDVLTFCGVWYMRMNTGRSKGRTLN